MYNKKIQATIDKNSERNQTVWGAKRQQLLPYYTRNTGRQGKPLNVPVWQDGIHTAYKGSDWKTNERNGTHGGYLFPLPPSRRLHLHLSLPHLRTVQAFTGAPLPAAFTFKSLPSPKHLCSFPFSISAQSADNIHINHRRHSHHHHAQRRPSPHPGTSSASWNLHSSA